MSMRNLFLVLEGWYCQYCVDLIKNDKSYETYSRVKGVQIFFMSDLLIHQLGPISQQSTEALLFCNNYC